MPSVYILYSKSLDKYYIGFTTLTPTERLQRHLDKFYKEVKTFTGKADDWILVWQLECSTAEQARNIEKHIKKMKSIRYIQNLIKYPEIRTKLLALYFRGSSPSSR